MPISPASILVPENLTNYLRELVMEDLICLIRRIITGLFDLYHIMSCHDPF